MAGYEFCKVVLLEQTGEEKIYGVIDTRFPKIGKPYTWSDKRTHGAIKERQRKHMQSKFFLSLIRNISG